MKNKKVECIELCSGFGATSLALEKALKKFGISLEILAISEIDKPAIRAYEAVHECEVIDFNEWKYESRKNRRE